MTVCTQAMGQENRIEEDVIYTKDGSIYRGEIVSSPDSNRVYIIILGGSRISLDKDNITAMERENVQKESDGFSPVKNRTPMYSHELRFGAPIGHLISDEVYIGASVSYTFQKHLWHFLKLGAGIGIERSLSLNTMYPLYMRVSGDFSTKRTSPFYLLELGYSSYLYDELNFYEREGGMMATIGTGLKIRTNSTFYLDLGLGYKFQTYKTIYSWPVGGHREINNVNRLFLSIALGFS